MTSLDWYILGANFLWVLGLSTILAAFSYLNWFRQETGQPSAWLFRERSWRVALGSGLSLVTMAIAIMPRSERWWTRLMALSLAIAFAIGAAQAFWRRSRR